MLVLPKIAARNVLRNKRRSAIIATRGTTFVFSTHDPKVMERASRLVHIRDGIIDRN